MSSSDPGVLLVVDDNEINRDMLQLRLRGRGHEVQGAAGGREALEMIAGNEFDLVLLDIMMPEMSGLEVLKILRERHSLAELPVIMATAKDETHDVVLALGLGANDYVTKPIDFPVLCARVETCLLLKRLSRLKDEFLSIASHDLRSPLSIIRTYATVLELTLKGAHTKESPLEIVSRIQHQTRTMETIVSDYLDFQALEDGALALRPELCNPAAALEQVVGEQSVFAERKQIRLTCDFHEEIPQACLDQSRFAQVLQNFLSNAIKFSPPQTEVQVRTRIRGERLRIEISDAGPGIAPDEMSKLFVKYARLSNRPTGGEKSSGLGLAICKRLVELQNGSVGAANNGERGATFWFEIPMSGVAEPLAAQGSEQSTTRSSPSASLSRT